MVGFQTFQTKLGSVTQSRNGFIITPEVFRQYRNILEGIKTISFSLVDENSWSLFERGDRHTFEDNMEEYSEDQEGKLIVIHQKILCPQLPNSTPQNRLPMHYSYENVSDNRGEFFYRNPFLMTDEFIDQINSFDFIKIGPWILSYRNTYQIFSSDERTTKQHEEMVGDIITRLDLGETIYYNGKLLESVDHFRSLLEH